jgi:hypothetical protein
LEEQGQENEEDKYKQMMKKKIRWRNKGSRMRKTSRR